MDDALAQKATPERTTRDPKDDQPAEVPVEERADIEILKIEVLDDCVQAFARASKKGKRVGFGSDGTVDIERFRFFSHRFPIDDENALRVAVERELQHTIRIVGKGDEKIVDGKLGNTTDTFFSDTGGTGTLEITATTNATTYSAAHDATTADTVATGTGIDGGIQNEVFGGQYLMMRMAIPFNTASLPDTDTISSATLSVYVQGGTRSGDGSSCTIVQYTGSSTAIVAANYNKTNFGTTSGGATALSAMTSAYTDVVLNATGLGWISTTGYTMIALRDSGDINNTTPTGINARLNLQNANDTNPPKLVIVHQAAVVANTPGLLLLGVG